MKRGTKARRQEAAAAAERRGRTPEQAPRQQPHDAKVLDLARPGPEAEGEEVADDGVPRSMVVRRGHLGKQLRELVADVRNVMAPHTAARLRERKSNTIKDFMTVAPLLRVTHLLAVSQSSSTGNPNIAIARVPRGPTLTFRVLEYALASQIRKAQRKPATPSQSTFAQPPVVVLNNFQGESRPRFVNVVGQTFQAMFPALDVGSVHLSQCRRVLLVHYDENEEVFEVRHYFVRADPQGASRAVRKIIQSKVGSLAHVKDVADVVERGAGLGAAGETSQYEADDPHAAVVLP